MAASKVTTKKMAVQKVAMNKVAPVIDLIVESGRVVAQKKINYAGDNIDNKDEENSTSEDKSDNYYPNDIRIKPFGLKPNDAINGQLAVFATEGMRE